MSGVGAQQVPEGYRKTDIGILPRDWGVINLSKLTVLMTNGFVGTAKTHYTDGLDGVIYIQGYNVEANSFNFRGVKKVTHEFHKRQSKSNLREGDVLMVQTGDVGLTTIVPKELEGANCHALIISRFKISKLSPLFFSYYLNSGEGRARLKELEVGTTMKHINVGDLLHFPVPVPPDRKEQTAIANALSDVDALVTSLEKLIAKKRAIKTAAMQQLLAGKKRLPPFDEIHTGYKKTELGDIPEDWEAGVFGDYLDMCSSGATPYRGRPEFYKGNIRWISSGELNYNVIYDTIEKLSDNAVKKTNLKIHPAGTFLIAITGLEAAGTRGSCGIVGAPSTTNQSCMALYPSQKLSTKFLFHYYVYKGDELALKYCQGTKQQSYTAKLVRLLPIVIPNTIEEQETIAGVLFDIDAEIKELEQRLNKTLQLKQGMMQELLTGRIRLV